MVNKLLSWIMEPSNMNADISSLSAVILTMIIWYWFQKFLLSTLIRISSKLHFVSIGQREFQKSLESVDFSSHSEGT